MCKHHTTKSSIKEDCRDFMSRPQAIVESVMLHLCVVLISLLAWRVTKKIAEARKKERTAESKRVGNWIYGTFMVSLTCAVIFVYVQFILYGVAHLVPFYVNCYWGAMPVIPMAIGRFLMYLFFLVRLHFCFGASPLRATLGYAPRTLKIAVAIIGIGLTAAVSFYLVHQYTTGCRLSPWASLPFILMDATTALTLCGMYLAQFRKAYLLTSEVLHESSSEQKIQELMKMLQVIAKLTCLTLVAVVTTIFLSGILTQVFVGAAGLYASDAVINTLCLALTLKHNKEWYDFLCLPCRQCCEAPLLKHVRVTVGRDVTLLSHSSHFQLASPTSSRQLPMTDVQQESVL